MKHILKHILIFSFLLSAIVKAIDFEKTILLFEDILGIGYENAGIVLSILIMVETSISYLIFKGLYKYRVVNVCILSMLGLFVLVNIVFLFQGADNCGCTGTIFVSDPGFSLLKSSLLFGIFIFFKTKNGDSSIC